MTRFVRRTPAHLRGQAVGLGSAGLIAVQGVGSVAAGVLASGWSPPAAVGMAGVAGVLSVAALRHPCAAPNRTPPRSSPVPAEAANPLRPALTVTD